MHKHKIRLPYILTNSVDSRIICNQKCPSKYILTGFIRPKRLSLSAFLPFIQKNYFGSSFIIKISFGHILWANYSETVLYVSRRYNDRICAMAQTVTTRCRCFTIQSESGNEWRRKRGKSQVKLGELVSKRKLSVVP